MKFTLSILALLAIVFLVGCSAKDTNNDIGKAELTELSKKYSGTYVFSRKFESEIKQREKGGLMNYLSSIELKVMKR